MYKLLTYDIGASEQYKNTETNCYLKVFNWFTYFIGEKSMTIFVFLSLVAH